MAVTAIPTDYAGVRFRSRLEAKWAAFFDRMLWRWTYEPNDYDGYIPDFRLNFRTPLLVEIKPLQWDESDEDEEILQGVRTKAVNSGIRGEFLVLGTDTIPGPMPRIGMMMEIDGQGASPWGFAFAFHCEHCGNASFASEDNSWHCRVRGCYSEKNGRDHLGEWDLDVDFRRAQSEVQWRRK